MPQLNAFQNEAELQKLLWKAIKDDVLGGLISDTASVGPASDKLNEGNAFPTFSIDHLVRRACLKSGAEVLRSLNFLIPLTDNKNISFAPGEIMRPDIVCINPERKCIVVFELKKAEQTGRQAVTELLAYEHEIKNLLPFLSNYDMHLVLVSSEWSTLMDHSVASAITWSGRKVLCLEASLKAKRLTLATRIPNAWTITGSVYFPDDALSSVTICLYEKDAYSPENARRGKVQKATDPDPRILTAMEIMARAGDHMGSHGFAFLWRDHLDVSLTSYNITIVGVSPFPFYREARIHQNIADDANEMVRMLDKYLVEHDPKGDSASLMEVAQIAFPLLREVAEPRIEQFSTWGVDQVSMRKRAEPLLCEFWGELGVYARAYVMHPAVRRHRANGVLGGMGDWRHPSVGLPLVSSFTRPQIFADGDVRCSDAFRLGVLIGLDQLIRDNLRKGNNSSELKCLFKWNWNELVSALDEVTLLASAATNVKPPGKPLRLSANPVKGNEKDARKLIDWLAKDFLRGQYFQLRVFEIGLNGALVFENQRRGIFREELPPEFASQIAAPIRKITHQTLSYFKTAMASGELSEVDQDAFLLLVRMLNLRKNFAWKNFDFLDVDVLIDAWKSTLEALDSIVPAVFHQHAPIAPVAFDWPWLKQGILEMRTRGIQDAGVILLPNGQLVTGPVFPKGFELPIKLDDPDNQVPYLDRSNGIGVMTVVTWEELEARFMAGGREDAPHRS